MKNKQQALKGLYGITDADLLPDLPRLLDAVEAALKGGMSILQYRDKRLGFDQQLVQAQALKELCEKYNALFIINDSIQLALELSAHGVHIGREDGAIANAREQLGPDAVIGCSCYDSLTMARTAQDGGADYVAFGRFFTSHTKPEASGVAKDILERAKTGLDIPLCAIGGITAQNAKPLLHQGADMLAVINDLFTASDIEARARQLSNLFT